MGWLENYRRKKAVKARLSELGAQGRLDHLAKNTTLVKVATVLTALTGTVGHLKEALAQSVNSANAISAIASADAMNIGDIVLDLRELNARANRLPSLERRFLREAIARRSSEVGRRSSEVRIDLITDMLSNLSSAIKGLDNELRTYLNELNILRSKPTPPDFSEVGSIVIGIEEALAYWGKTDTPDNKLPQIRKILDEIYGDILMIREAGSNEERVNQLMEHYENTNSALDQVVQLVSKLKQDTSQFNLILLPDTRSLRQRGEAVQRARAEKMRRASEAARNAQAGRR